MAQGHQVVVVVAAWSCGAETVEVVDIDGRLVAAGSLADRVRSAVLVGLGAPASVVAAGSGVGSVGVSTLLSGAAMKIAGLEVGAAGLRADLGAGAHGRTSRPLPRRVHALGRFARTICGFVVSVVVETFALLAEAVAVSLVGDPGDDVGSAGAFPAFVAGGAEAAAEAVSGVLVGVDAFDPGAVGFAFAGAVEAGVGVAGEHLCDLVVLGQESEESVGEA